MKFKKSVNEYRWNKMFGISTRNICKKKVKNINNQKVKCMFYKNSVIIYQTLYTQQLSEIAIKDC